MNPRVRRILRKRAETLRKYQKNLCCWCGSEMQKVNRHRWDYETIEHVTPLSKGGTHEMANLALAHKLCNLTRGNEEREPRFRIAQ